MFLLTTWSMLYFVIDEFTGTQNNTMIFLAKSAKQITENLSKVLWELSVRELFLKKYTISMPKK